jgi:hypothetical protein
MQHLGIDLPLLAIDSRLLPHVTGHGTGHATRGWPRTNEAEPRRRGAGCLRASWFILGNMTKARRRRVVAAQRALAAYRTWSAEIAEWGVMSDDLLAPMSEWDIGQLLGSLQNYRERRLVEGVFVASGLLDVTELAVPHPIRAPAPSIYAGTPLAGRTVLDSPMVPMAPPTTALAHVREGLVWLRGSREDALAA